MGIVTNVRWDCPGCYTVNNAQLYEDLYAPNDTECAPISHKQLPYGASLKWNPPCKKCGEYQLREPKSLIDFPVVKLEDE